MGKLKKHQIVADYGPQLIEQLLAEPGQSYQHTLSDDGVACITRYQQWRDHEHTLSPEELQRTVVTPVIRELMDDHLAPHKGYDALSGDVLHWILRATLAASHNGAPVLAEDLYKYGEALAYFDSVKTDTAFTQDPDTSNDLLAYTGWAELEAVLQPYRDKAAAKQAERRERHMDAQSRNRIMRETTVLYDGPEGKIVAPHTAYASQHWGNQTKWCISGKYAEENFPDYYNASLVLMLIPAGDKGKTALVDKRIFDDQDRVQDALRPGAQALFNAGLACHAGTARENLLTKALPDRESGEPELAANDNAEDEAPAAWAQELRERLDTTAQAKLGEFFDYLGDSRRDIERNRPDIAAYLDNHNFIYAAVAQDWSALRYASEDLQADRDIVLTAVTQDGLALQYASDERRADRDIAQTAVAQQGFALRLASPDLRSDREFIQAAVAQNGDALRYASEDLRADREIVQTAVENAGLVLGWAASELRDDRGIVKTAFTQDGFALEFASEDLQADRDIVQIAVAQYGRALEFAGPELRADREIVQTAVAQQGFALQYAKSKVRADCEVVKTAVTHQGSSLRYASEDLRADRDIVQRAVAQYGFALQYASEDLRSDREIVKTAVAQDHFALKFASVECRSDREIVQAAVARDGRALLYASPDLQADPEIAKAAIAQYAAVLNLLDDSLKQDPEFMYNVMVDVPQAAKFMALRFEEDEFDHQAWDAVLQGLVDGNHIDQARDIMRHFPACQGSPERLYPDDPLATFRACVRDNTARNTPGTPRPTRAA